MRRKSAIRVDRDIPIKMRDGVTLYADVYRPEDNKKHPAILSRTPYNKALAGRGDYLSLVEAAFTGYAVVVQDVRGRFASEGEYPSRTDGLDGYDTVEWIAAEPWCDGNVGMWGGSAVAATQYTVAFENPPHLKAIAPAISRYGPLEEICLLSGVTRLETSVNIIPLFGLDVIDRMEKQGRDVTKMREMMDRLLFNREEALNFLPLKELPHVQFEFLRELFNAWVLNHVPGPIRSKEDFFWPLERVEVPCFHVGGWYDLHNGGMFKTFLKLREIGGSRRAREGQHLLYGPWPHSANLPPFTGSLYFGHQAGGGPSPMGERTSLSERHLEFYDKYLRGMDIDLPPIRYFVMGRNTWETADTWPLPKTQWQRFFLHSKGHANTAAGDGVFSRDEPGVEEPDIFIYNPHFPVPTEGGRDIEFTLRAGPMDQYHIEKRDDVLCYTTPELDADIEVTGPIAIHLFTATSARDTDFTAKLVDVHPDGKAYNIADGILRARYRKSILEPELVNPDDINEYCIDMGVTSNLFLKGHRIRIDVSSSNFPRYDRNMNTGNPIGEDARGVPAMQAIYHQAEYASYIDLPIIPR